MAKISPNTGIRKQIIQFKIMVMLVHDAHDPKFLFCTVELGSQEILRK